MLIDGIPEDRIPVDDRGLNYGDGLFETLNLSRGGPCLWQRHLDRLEAGCRRLGITAPDPCLLRHEAARVIAGRRDGVLKILITRGSSGRGYRPDPQAQPRRLLQWLPAPNYPSDARTQGVLLRFCATPMARNPRLAGIKHLNRLEQVLARSEWDDPAISEGLMLDSEGLVIEGTISNLFVEADDKLLTPKLDQAGVQGVVRGLVLEGARSLGVECQERELIVADLTEADALFLTNSLFGIWPVSRLEGRSYRPGKWTRELQQLLLPAILDTPEWQASDRRETTPGSTA